MTDYFGSGAFLAWMNVYFVLSKFYNFLSAQWILSFLSIKILSFCKAIYLLIPYLENSNVPSNLKKKGIILICDSIHIYVFACKLQKLILVWFSPANIYQDFACKPENQKLWPIDLGIIS